MGDFRAIQPLWKRVINGFLKSNENNAVLLFWLGENATQQDFFDARDFINSIGIANGQLIYLIPPVEGKIFEPYLLRNSTHFITTREFINIDCLDYLYDTEVKVISALDDNIFDGEPPVNWGEIYF